MKKNVTIDLLDDNVSARQGLTRLLLGAGYEVLAFASLEDGSADIIQARFQVVF